MSCQCANRIQPAQQVQVWQLKAGAFCEQQLLGNLQSLLTQAARQLLTVRGSCGPASLADGSFRTVISSLPDLYPQAASLRRRDFPAEPSTGAQHLLT